MSILLALDVATEACSVALSVQGKVLEKFAIAPQRHGEIILSFVDQLLSETGVSLSSVDAVAFGQGPGSFMGVRIATGVAQGLADAIDRPVIPISTLQVLAQVAYEETKAPLILSGWDARMGEIYWGIFEKDTDNLMQPCQAEQLSHPSNIVLRDNKTYLAVGNAWRVYQSALPSPIFDKITDTKPDLYPHAALMIKFAERHYLNGNTLLAEAAEPRYLRNDIARKPQII